jgi:hypothetical protein
MTLFTGNVPGAQQNSFQKQRGKKVDDEGGKLSLVLRGKRENSLSLSVSPRKTKYLAAAE